MSPHGDMTLLPEVIGNATQPPPTDHHHSHNFYTQTHLDEYDNHNHQRAIRPTLPNEAWGDRLLPPKSQHTCRIIFNNANGISSWNQLSDLDSLGDACNKYEATIIALAETNLHGNDPHLRTTFTQRLRKYWTQFKMSLCSSLQHVGTGYYQPGGTALFVTPPWTRHTRMSYDPTGLGRWSEATITGKAGRAITFISGYRVCKTTEDDMGPTTAYKQQWTMLRLKGDEQPNPRKRFLQDLQARVKQLQLQKTAVFLMLDANESMDDLGDLATWVRELDLIDVHTDRHGVEAIPETYNRGTQRIDYMFASPCLSDYITHASIRPYADFLPSDHRALIVDMNLQQYLAYAPPDITTEAQRGIGTNHPGRILHYRKQLTKFLDESDIESTLAELNSNAAHGKQIQPDKIEYIDRELTTCLLQLDQQCQHIPDYPWSPELMAAKKTLDFWKLWRTEMRTHRDLSRQRAALDIPNQPTENPTRATINHALRSAAKSLRKAITDREQLRDAHLDRCAEMASAKGNITKLAALRRIKRSELSRRTFRKIRRAMGTTKNGQLDYLIDKPTTSDGNFLRDEQGRDIEHIFTDPDEINTKIITRNQRHFSQAEGTPFAAPTLRDLFGQFGTNDTSQRLLDGQLDIASLPVSAATKAILYQLRRTAPPNSLSAHLTADDLRAGYKVWRESTATSPSGRHLGHDKVLFCYEPDQEPDEDEAPRLSTRMFHIKASLINLATYSGHVLERWKTVHTLMFEKVTGWPYIEKLRVIHLLESDFNLMVGILFSRRTMQAAEAIGALGQGNAGSRKDRSAEEVHLLKHVLYGITRITQTNAASFDNDAKSCFDRIVPLLVSLICQRYGMEAKACELLLKVWYHSRYHARTQHGVSESSFGGPTTHGTGQGGKGSANFWSLISATIEACMPQKTSGFQARDPYNDHAVQLILTAFVDDASHWINRFTEALQGNYGLPAMIHDTQQAAQWWEQLLYVTGGKLELPKCFYYMIHWQFNNEGEAELAPPDTSQPPIIVIDSETNEPIQIRQQDSYVEHKTLGAYESPAPNYHPEYQRLRKKSRIMIQRLATAAFNPHEAQTFFRSVYLPSIAYTFPTGILYQEDCKTIQSDLLRHLLPQMGYNPNTPRALVHGPKFLGGIGIQDLFCTQGSAKCIRLIQHLRSSRPLGDALRVYLQWAQRQAGIPQSILHYTKPLPHLHGEQWLETLREFLHASDLSIHTTNLHPPAPQRHHDIILMDYILHQPLHQPYYHPPTKSMPRLPPSRDLS